MLTVAARAGSCKFVPNALRDCACRRSRDTGHKNRKLIASKTADHVCGAQVSARNLHQVPQRLVTNPMAVLIVDQLEFVEIKNGDA